MLVFVYWPNYNVLLERWHCSTVHCGFVMQTGLFHLFFIPVIQLMIKSNSCRDSVSSVGRVPVCWAYPNGQTTNQGLQKGKLIGEILLAVIKSLCQKGWETWAKLKLLHSAPLHADVVLTSLVVPTQFSHRWQGRKVGSRSFIWLFK